MIVGLGIPNTAANRNFLVGWELYDPSPCRYNPLLASVKWAGSTGCARLNALNTAQAYGTPPAAVSGTRAELRSGGYAHLLAALKSGDPFGVDNLAGVALDLQKWGAVGWQRELIRRYSLPGGAPGAAGPAHVSFAWARWMRTLAHTGPDAERRIRVATARIRRLSRQR